MHDPTDPNDPPPDLMLGILLTAGIFAAIILIMIIGFARR